MNTAPNLSTDPNPRAQIICPVKFNNGARCDFSVGEPHMPSKSKIGCHGHPDYRCLVNWLSCDPEDREPYDTYCASEGNTS